MKRTFGYKRVAITILAIMAQLFGLMLIIESINTNIVSAYYDSAEDIYYSSLGDARKETESFTYATKTSESYYINTTFPNYFNNNNNLENTCANVAGANIIGYYDRFYDSLIPNVNVGIEKNNKYTYYPMKVVATQIQGVINDLYIRMKTNQIIPGNTQTAYKDGIKSYVQTMGLNTSYVSVMSNGSFDLEKAKIQLKNGNPISLFMSGYNFTNITDNGTTVTLNKNLFDGNHIAIVYGYEKVTYFNNNGGVIKTEIYLNVSTGINGVIGVYIVNKYGNLNDAEAAHIG